MSFSTSFINHPHNLFVGFNAPFILVRGWQVNTFQELLQLPSNAPICLGYNDAIIILCRNWSVWVKAIHVICVLLEKNLNLYF